MSWSSCSTFLTASLMLTAVPAFADSTQDARLEGAVQTAVSLNRLLNPYRIEVQVKEAHARLSGEVENLVERDLAEQVAMATRGIEQVDNHLQINEHLAEGPLERRAYAQRLEDATLTSIVRARLSWSQVTQQAPIEVQSQQGVVTLRGRVDSVEAKELAGVIARTSEGVYLVNNLISLDSSALAKARENAATAPSGPQPSDAWIVDKVQSSFGFSRNLDGPTIKVSSQEGMVRLSGEVMSDEQKTIAAQIAGQIRGVRGVDADLLKVARKVEG